MLSRVKRRIGIPTMASGLASIESIIHQSVEQRIQRSSGVQARVFRAFRATVEGYLLNFVAVVTYLELFRV